jgi:hypothetical protein
MTEFERSGMLKTARDRVKKTQWLLWAISFTALAALTPVTNLVVGTGAMRDYRLWTLEQLGLATAYLLGPIEPMVAGEATILAPFPGDIGTRDLAVAVTAAHVLVFRIDFPDGQPRSIALVGRPTDVKIELRSGALLVGPALMVSGRSGLWTIRGSPGVFQPEPVLDAWRQAAISTASTG